MDCLHVSIMTDPEENARVGPLRIGPVLGIQPGLQRFELGGLGLIRPACFDQIGQFVITRGLVLGRLDRFRICLLYTSPSPRDRG